MTKSHLLLLHGALGTEKQLKPLQTLLSHSFEVTTINFEGHGGRSPSKTFSIDLFTENAIRFLKENNIESTHIFGYSMGGYVALNMAKKHPAFVQSIITLGTKFNWTKETAEKEIRFLDPNAIEEKVPRFAKKLEEDHAPNDWKVLLKKTAEMMIGLGSGLRLTDTDLSSISHRTLICLGSLDTMVTIEESEQAAKQLKNGHFKIITDFEHPIEKIDAKLFASIIVNFLQN